MSRNNKKTFILSIITVLIMGVIITSGTFAYLQWSMNYANGTGVNVTIEHGGITMHIEPEATEFVGLYPTADCTTNHRYADALVTIVNNTGTLAIPSFKLKVRVTKGGSGELTQEALSHINYAVVPIETTKNIFGRPVKGDVGSYSCSNVAYGSDEADGDQNYQKLFANAQVWYSHLKFESVAVDGSWSHIPNEDDYARSYPLLHTPAYLPRQYYLSDGNGEFQKGDVNGITFRGEAYSTSYQYFRVYVWIDEGYTTTTIGNVVSDPLQNAKIEVTWSEQSTVQQVSGESGEQAIAAGLYDENGNLTSTWGELVGDGSITVSTNAREKILETVSTDLRGVLVVSSEITAIGYHAFSSVSLDELRFESGSMLGEIHQNAFEVATIEKVILPSSLYVFADYAMAYADITELHFEGTIAQWNAIERVSASWCEGLTATEVICSDGSVDIS